MKVSFMPLYDYPLQIVGESNYQENIHALIDYDEEDEEFEKNYRNEGLSAELILEDDNTHDIGNAVRVDVEGQTVGYLTKTDAKKYRESLAELKVPNATGTCDAVIIGGWNNEHAGMLFGVWLDLDIDNLILSFTSQNQIQSKNPVQKAKKPVSKSSNKIPFIPMNGKGCIYWLIVFPIVGIINLYILLFVGGWYLIKGLFNAIPSNMQTPALFAIIILLGIILGISTFINNP